MALNEIIQKNVVVDTPSASDLAERPSEWANRFQFHVSTHVAIADMTDKWDAILKNILRGHSATGLIHADTGYGKTSTAVALWHYAENHDVVTVPPFAWNSIADMLTATHGWVCHRLKEKRPDLIPGIEQQYKTLIESSDEARARRVSQEENIPLDHAKRVVQSLKAKGKLTDSISANRLIDYLREATPMLIEADYKGLLILPDEFELFANTNPDIAKNFSELKDFIFPIFQEENLPIGCVVLTYRQTFSEIQLREPYILARFNKPQGSLINLEQAYGKINNDRSFAHELWEKLSVQCNLSSEEQNAIDPDVLFALGQFLGHQRTTQLISGPRSVVATLRRAAIHYTETQQPYSIFDFCEDYISQGIICFNNQETDAVKAYTSILNQPIIGGDEAKQKVVKLLCVCPDGVPDKLFKKYGISDEDRSAVVEGLLGSHVITKIVGPTLTHYKDDLQAGDALIELLKVLRNQYNPASAETHRTAVRSFANFILPEIFSQTVGASFTGWRGLKKMEGNIEPIYQAALLGTSLRDYPNRTLTVHVGTENFQEISGAYRESLLFTTFILHTQQDKHIPNTCDIHADKVCFHLNISEAIDKLEIPKDIGKLGDLFLPESVTPSLLLSMLDFFAKETTLAQIKELKQDAQVQLLESQIRNQLIGYFFSAEVKESAVLQQADLAQVPAGKNFVERTLGVLIREKFKSYRAIAISHQWKKNLVTYIQALKNVESLGVRRGEEPVKRISGDVPKMFNIGQHTTFSNTFYPNGILRDLLLVNELDPNGKTVAEGVEVKNNQVPVAVYFKFHDVEKRILKMLEKSEESIVVNGKRTEAIKCHEVFQQEIKLGYLNEEVEELIKVLKARGLVDQKSQRGIDYLYRVDTEINFIQLQRKFEQLETLDTLAKSKGFTSETEGDNSLSSVQADFQVIGIESDEVRKDSLRQKLNSIEDAFTTQCAGWLYTEKQRVDQKRYEIEPLRLDIPKVLDETKGHPLTEFSTLLFNDIRSGVKKAYTTLSGQISALQNEVKDTLNEKLHSYTEDGSLEKAIDVASQLRDFCDVIDTKINGLQTSGKEAEQLYTSFEKWRTLARHIENDRQIMHEAQSNDAINNLIGRLDTEQQQIKKHLANRTLSLGQVLENHEYFAKRFSEIKDEYDQVTANRRDVFIKFQAEIEKELDELLEKPHIGEPYNPLDEDGSYRRVLEKVVERIQEFREKAVKSVQAIMGDLMKPIEVFEVKPKVKNDAMALQEKLSALEIRISHIDRKLKPDGIEDQLSELVQSLLTMREEGTELVQQWEDIQGQLRCDKSELSPKARALLDLIEMDTDKDFTELIIDLRQSGNEMFGSTSEIIKSLEELYQHNWLNIKISRTTA
ncbi:MAG: hypothetical protein F4W91_22875 [Gemmatimonadetes bacterium]|nr:hypothetical protein [Gemmatimonadota bacterium]